MKRFYYLASAMAAAMLCGGAYAADMQPAKVILPTGNYHSEMLQFSITWDKQEVALTGNGAKGSLVINGTDNAAIEYRLINCDETGPDSGSTDGNYGDDDRKLNGMTVSISYAPEDSYKWFWGGPKGEYKFHLPAGIVKNNAGDLNPAQDFVFTVMNQVPVEDVPEVTPFANYVWDIPSGSMIDQPAVRVNRLGIVTVEWPGYEAKLVNKGPVTFSSVSRNSDVTDIRIEDNKLVLNVAPFANEMGVCSVNIGGNLVLLTKDGEETLNRELYYNYELLLADLPKVSSYPADGYTSWWLDDHASINWNYQELKLVDPSLITFTYNGELVPVRGVTLASVLVDDEGNSTPDLGGGAPTDTPEVDNTLVVNFGDWMLDQGVYVLTIPAGTVNVKVEDAFVPNDQVSFTYYVAPMNATDIVPVFATVGEDLYADDAVVTLNWDNYPIEINRPDFDMQLIHDSDVSVPRPGMQVSVVDGTTLRIDLSDINFGAGDYQLFLNANGVRISETETAPLAIDPFDSNTKYNAAQTFTLSIKEAKNPEPDPDPDPDPEPDPGAVGAIGADQAGVWTVYNVNGVRVMQTRDEADLNSLPKGFYIVNGKKVVK